MIHFCYCVFSCFLFLVDLHPVTHAESRRMCLDPDVVPPMAGFRLYAILGDFHHVLSVPSVCSRSCALRAPVSKSRICLGFNRPQGPGDPIRAQGASVGRPQQPHPHPGRRQQDEERLDLSSPIPSAGWRKTRPFIPFPHHRELDFSRMRPTLRAGLCCVDHQRTRLFSDEIYLGSWPLLCLGQQPQRMRFTVVHPIIL